MIGFAELFAAVASAWGYSRHQVRRAPESLQAQLPIFARFGASQVRPAIRSGARYIGVPDPGSWRTLRVSVIPKGGDIETLQPFRCEQRAAPEISHPDLQAHSDSQFSPTSERNLKVARLPWVPLYSIERAFELVSMRSGSVSSRSNPGVCPDWKGAHRGNFGRNCEEAKIFDRQMR
jgi:hypothetical protein